jgi:hypothetical protein
MIPLHPTRPTLVLRLQTIDSGSSSNSRFMAHEPQPQAQLRARARTETLQTDTMGTRKALDLRKEPEPLESRPRGWAMGS